LLDEEGSTKTEFEKIWVAQQSPVDRDEVLNVIDELLEKCGKLKTEEIKEIMRRVIPKIK